MRTKLKVFGAIVCILSILSSGVSVFAAGYDVIREPWLDALMEIEHIDNDYFAYDRPLLLYPTVFKNGAATVYEKSYVVPGYEATFFCDNMYKVNYNGDAITDKKTADNFSFSPSYEGEHVEIPDYEGAYWEENLDEIIFFPNEWTWCDDYELEYKTSKKYFEEPSTVDFLDGMFGYGYYDWAEYQLESTYSDKYDEYGQPIPSETVCSYKYYNGFSTAFQNGKAGVIDEEDNIIVPFEYDMILPIANEDGYTWVLKNGKWGIITVDNQTVTVKVDNEDVVFDQIPLIINGRTLAPLRAIFEKLGATVEWNGETQTITSTKGDTVITMTIDKNEMYKNGEMIWLDVAPQIVGERTLVPVRAIAEAFNCDVTWDGENHTVNIAK